MDQEQRAGRRQAIELKVAYTQQNAFFADYARNISKGGTFIETSRPLPQGTLFRFRLQVPGLDEPLELQGEVRWLSDGSGDHPPGMGIRFLFQDEAERRLLADTVEDLMSRSLGRELSHKLLER